MTADPVTSPMANLKLPQTNHGTKHGVEFWIRSLKTRGFPPRGRLAGTLKVCCKAQRICDKNMAPFD